MQDEDQQLLESMALRRDRLVAASLQGPDRGRRNYRDNLRSAFIGVVLAALISAGCVATSFVTDLLGRERAKQEQQQQQRMIPTPTPTQRPVPATQSPRPTTKASQAPKPSTQAPSTGKE